MKIYVASSWRNDFQPTVVEGLRAAGHEVYDFRNPPNGNGGFKWSDIDPKWESWDARDFRLKLDNDVAVKGFMSDMEGLEWCDICVLVLPCGRSAHLELGWAAGSNRHTIAYLVDGEPELMYKMVDHLVTSMQEMYAVIGGIEEAESARPIDALEPGCYIDSNQGHYAMARLINLARRWGYRLDPFEEFALANYDLHYQEDLYPTSAMDDLADSVIDWLNQDEDQMPIIGIQPVPPKRAEGHYWDWKDGDFGLWPIEEDE